MCVVSVCVVFVCVLCLCVCVFEPKAPLSYVLCVLWLLFEMMLLFYNVVYLFVCACCALHNCACLKGFVLFHMKLKTAPVRLNQECSAKGHAGADAIRFLGHLGCLGKDWKLWFRKNGKRRMQTIKNLVLESMCSFCRNFVCLRRTLAVAMR